MPKKTFPMTEKGLGKLKSELHELETDKRKEAKQRIKQARTFCDFGEDSEYEAALKEQAAIEERISHINEMIQHVKIIKKTSETSVALGSTVSFKEIPNGELETYTIVGVEEADPFSGNISHKSPIATSILGAKVHDEVTVNTPNGKRKVEIVSIS